MLEGVVDVPHPARSTPGGVQITRGDRGVGVQLGMLQRIFDHSEPAWETGDDRAKLEGSQRVATSSPLDISLVVTPGACTSQPLQFFGLRVSGGARQGD